MIFDVLFISVKNEKTIFCFQSITLEPFLFLNKLFILVSPK